MGLFLTLLDVSARFLNPLRRPPGEEPPDEEPRVEQPAREENAEPDEEDR